MNEPMALGDIRGTIEWITFDCYGTLVDWETGLRQAVREVSGNDDPAMFDAFLGIEAEIEAGPFQSYHDVQAETLRRLAERFGFQVRPNQVDVLSRTLPDWPVWADTNAALRRLKCQYKIGVLSNIDRELFAGTARHFEIEVDLLIAAEDVRAYKPSARHFTRMLTHVDGDKNRMLHAAQSLYHDCVPATHLEIANVWINRRGETNTTTAKPMAEFPDLTGLADALGV